MDLDWSKSASPFLTNSGGKTGQFLSEENRPKRLFATPLKFNMEPKNDAFQKESPFPGVDFQVPC